MTPRKATTLQLVFMTYSVICSGAYGLEEMISGSGPGMALLTLIILPVLIFLPFLGLTLLGLFHWQFNPFVPFVAPDKGPLQAFAAGLGIAIWLYSGYEKLTTNAGEVENPSRAFPIALAISLPMTAGSYIIPTFAALAGHRHCSEWGESHFSVAARALGGPALGMAMAAGGMVNST